MSYDIIYADPPWRYGSRGARGGKFGPLDYSTMSESELCALDVASVAAESCALLMWSTGPFIEQAIRVGVAWGFGYVRVDKVWEKVKSTGGRHGVVGPWGMTDAEFLLLFVRGSMCGHQRERNQWVHHRAVYPGKHSGKPEVFRQQIERRFDDEIDGRSIRRLEMFARETPAGWDVWGNEVKSAIEIMEVA